MRDIMVEPIETWFHPSFVSYYLTRHVTDQAPNDANVIKNIITICVQKAGCSGGTERNSVSPFIRDRSSCSPRNRTYIKLNKCSYVRRYYLNFEFGMLWATPNQNRFSPSWPVWRLGNNALLTNTKRHAFAHIFFHTYKKKIAARYGSDTSAYWSHNELRESCHGQVSILATSHEVPTTHRLAPNFSYSKQYMITTNIQKARWNGDSNVREPAKLDFRGQLSRSLLYQNGRKYRQNS